MCLERILSSLQFAKRSIQVGGFLSHPRWPAAAPHECGEIPCVASNRRSRGSEGLTGMIRFTVGFVFEGGSSLSIMCLNLLHFIVIMLFFSLPD